MYVVTNGSYYVKTNTELTSHINEAKKFQTISLAENAQQSMKKTFKKIGMWTVIECPEPIQRSEDSTMGLTNKGKVTSIIDIDTASKSYELAETIYDSYKELLSYRIALRATISEKEKETQDILHFVEFYDLDAYNGYLIYKKLQEIRLERRRAKDELIRVNHFLKVNFKAINEVDKKETEKKSYTPRVLIDLFKRKWKLHTDKRKDIKDED